MERAARLFKNKKISADIMTDEDLVRAAWPIAVGRIISSHTSRVRLVRTTLVVEVEDSIWQRQLYGLSKQIVGRLQRVMGGCPVLDVEFRVGVPRRQVQRSEERRSPGLFEEIARPADESDAIRDPVLKRLYRLSRKKATA